MDEEIARKLTRRLLRVGEPLPFSSLMEHTDVSRKDLIRIIKKFEGNFYIGHVDMQVYVKLRIPLDICPEHSSIDEDCLDPSVCSNLHICKRYLSSDSCPHQENNCSSGHDMSTPHNVSRLQRYLLYGIPINELRKLFKKSRYLKVSRLPKICKFYNVKQGCRKPGKACPYIHMCQPFIRGKCSFGAECRINHDIFEPSVKAVLEKHEVKMQRPAKEILAELRDALDFGDDVTDEAASPAKECSDECDISQKSDPPAELMTNQQAPRNRTSNPMPAVTDEAEHKKLFTKPSSRKVSRLPKICNFYNFQQGCRNSESGKTCPHMHMCKPYLEGKCKFGQKCRRNHNIFEAGVKAVLEKHEVNMQRPAKEILAELRDDVADEAASPPKECSDECDISQKSDPPAELMTNQQAPGNRASNPISAVTEEAEHKQLFKKPSSCIGSRLPMICKFYNVQKGCRNSESGKTCPHMHICKPYLEGKCKFGKKCLRNHDIFEAGVKAVLEKHDVDIQRTVKEILAELRGAMGIEDDLADEAAFRPQELGAASAAGDVLETPEDGGRDAPICIYNLQGRCQFGSKCRNIHRDMTYAWQIRESGQEVWQDVDGKTNTELELTYSNQDNSEFCAKLPEEILLLNFNTMSATAPKGRQFDVRRLSTISGGQVEGLPLATEWRWYWLNHTGQWIKYGKGDKSDCNYKSNLSSLDVEQKYLDNPDGQIEFVTSGHEYNLDFRRMLQANKRHKTERKVCRRPVFVTSEDMEIRKKASRAVPLRTPDGGKLQGAKLLPELWTVKGDIDALEHFQQVQVTKDDPMTLEEYTDIETLFFKTMPRTASITSIHRVENGDLWLNYANKLENMKKKNGGKNIEEMRLFHGTQTRYVDAICRQGFDFRLSGKTVGTLYGKGSYFALNAKYSDSYTETLKKMMFVVKVLVGDFVKGIPSYVRPPLKDPSDLSSALYDSCVNDEKDPSIFVIFEFNQVYPEYLIRYNI